MNRTRISRRSFVSSVAGSAIGLSIVPRHVLGGPGYVAPSDRVNLAVIGAGAQGMSNVSGPVQEDHNLVALADVDFGFVDERLAAPGGGDPAAREKLRTAYGKAMRYADFREMLEREHANLDGVIVATADHTHAVATIPAMELGLAVYVQKPLTNSVYESRKLLEVARRTGVVTQMGNQGHSNDVTKRSIELVRAGIIGSVREVHVWASAPRAWPTAIARPTSASLNPRTADPTIEQLTAAGVDTSGAATGMAGEQGNPWRGRDLGQVLLARSMAGSHPVPQGLNWDLFIGPAKMVPYHPVYHPFNWRGWVDWGGSGLGDFGAHHMDAPFHALELGLPYSISAISTPFGMDVDSKPATWPQAMTVQYRFAARGNRPPVKMFWYDGGLMPHRPELIPHDVPLNTVILVGDRGILMHGGRGGGDWRFFPESLQAEADRVPETLPRVPHSHVMNWVHAIRGEATPQSTFEQACPLSETMALGLVAALAGPARELLYDAQNMRFTNVPDADHLLKPNYRSGWAI